MEYHRQKRNGVLPNRRQAHGKYLPLQAYEGLLANDNPCRRWRHLGECSDLRRKRGNTQGICALAKDRPIEEVIGMIEGIKCRQKPASCPDQLARGLRIALDAKRGNK